MQNYDTFLRHPKNLKWCFNIFANDVHVGVWSQKYTFTLKFSILTIAISFLPVSQACSLGQMVKAKKANIMPGLRILSAHVPKANDLKWLAG